jgi:competence protein ComEC
MIPQGLPVAYQVTKTGEPLLLGVYLFPILVLAFANGILLGKLLPVQELWPFPCFVLLGLWIPFMWKGKWLAGQRILAILVFLTLGAWHGQRVGLKSLPQEDPLGFCGAELCDLEGTLIRSPELRLDGTRLLLELETLFQGSEAKEIRGRMFLNIEKGGDQFRYGDRLRFKTFLRVAEPRLNPGTLDRARVLALQGVGLLGFLPDAEHMLLMERGRGHWARQKMEDLRWDLTRVISAEFPSPSREVILALVVGQAGALPSQLRDAFATLGLSHLLAISGLHFGLVALCVYWVSLKLLSLWAWLVLRFPVQKLAWLITVPVLLVYGTVAGMAPSVQRSLIMVLALAAALILDRTRRLYHALALAALIILVLNPSCIFELSFQLSFLAVMGILYVAPKLMSYLPRGNQELLPGKRKALHSWGRRALLAAATTLAASLATMPLVVMRFHMFPLLGIPANLVGVPLVGWVVLPMALLGSFLYLSWESVGLALLWVAAWMADWAVKMILWAASIGGVIYLPTPRAWEIVIYYLICIGLCSFGKSRWAARATLGLVFLLMMLWAYEGVAKLRDPELRLHFIAVGNGTSVLIQAPGGESLLLDGGGNLEGRPDVGAMQVAPVLWERRIMSLNRVILSHPHPDHLGGLLFILRAFKVKDGVWDNGHRPNDPQYLEFLKAVQATGWRPRALCSGESWGIGQARLEVLHPPCGGFSLKSKSRASETNNRSLVLRVSMGQVSVLLPGDLEAEAEKLLLEKHDLASTVLLAPHHGSKTSSTGEFLKRVMPSIVIFSSKAGERGLVHPEILQRYKELGAEILHTGEDGMVSLETDGSDLRVRTYLTNRSISLRKDSS